MRPHPWDAQAQVKSAPCTVARREDVDCHAWVQEADREGAVSPHTMTIVFCGGGHSMTWALPFQIVTQFEKSEILLHDFLKNGRELCNQTCWPHSPPIPKCGQQVWLRSSCPFLRKSCHKKSASS